MLLLRGLPPIFLFEGGLDDRRVYHKALALFLCWEFVKGELNGTTMGGWTLVELEHFPNFSFFFGS